MKRPLALKYLCLTTALGLFAFGCGEDAAVNTISAPGQPSAALQQDLDVGFGEIDAMTRTGDSAGAFDVSNTIVRRLDRGIADGEITTDRAMDSVKRLSAVVAEIDIDVHFGTDEKCDAAHQCVTGKRNCVSVTWHDESGGGRNCYNFGGTAGAQKIK